MTWESMRKAHILPTPRNYEVWFAFCGADKLGLQQRLTTMLETGKPITPGVLDDLYREFFATAVDLTTARDASTDLQQIAGEMVQRVAIDREMLDAFGKTLFTVSESLSPTITAEDLRRASTTVETASAQASERLRALEHLLSAAIVNIAGLRERLLAAERDATIDSLTGLANRRLFDASLARASQQSTEEGSDLSLLMLDIDHFKRFNDTHGHMVGDNVLRLFARMLLEQIKGRDTAARYGGEEFAVILPGASLPGALSVAEQMRGTIGRHPIVNRTSGKNLGVVTCSIGVSRYRAGEPVGDLVHRTDLALYQAKRGGRNKVCAAEL